MGAFSMQIETAKVHRMGAGPRPEILSQIVKDRHRPTKISLPPGLSLRNFAPDVSRFEREIGVNSEKVNL
jgi:hypothetical protein